MMQEDQNNKENSFEQNLQELAAIVSSLEKGISRWRRQYLSTVKE